MSYTCYRFFAYKNYSTREVVVGLLAARALFLFFNCKNCNMRVIAVSFILFHFSACKNYNIGEIAANMPITGMLVSKALFFFFN